MYIIGLRSSLILAGEEEYDVAVLRKFVDLFPYSVFATLILAYFAYAGTQPMTDPESPPPVTIEYEDSFDAIQVSVLDC